MKRFLSLLAAAVLLLSLAAVPALAEDATISYRYVKTANYGSLNLREDASTNAKVMTKIPYGAKVTLIDYFVGSTWANVTYNGYYGYVQVRYLSLKKPAAKPTAKPTAKVTPKPTVKPTATPAGSLYADFVPAYYVAQVTPSTPTGFVHMRWAPTKSESIAREYYAGMQLVVLYETDTWCQVYDETNHVTGYMMREFLNFLMPWDQTGDGAGTNAN